MTRMVRAAQRLEREHVGARYARVQDVADDGHRQVFEAALVATNRQHVEHALGRVRMAAVTAVDDRHVRAHMLGNKMRCARIGMAHDKHVGSHRFKVAQGVEQRFALAGGRGRNVQGDHIGRQPLCRQFEGGAGACRVFEEHVAHRLAAQQRDLLHRSGADLKKRVSGVEDFGEQLAGQAVQRQKMAQLAQMVELQRALGVERRHRNGLFKGRWRGLEARAPLARGRTA